jgi:hypothetical protein
MNTEVDRAAALLFPENGRQALDVKFFFESGASAQALAQQVINCFESMCDGSQVITDIDGDLTA